MRIRISVDDLTQKQAIDLATKIPATGFRIDSMGGRDRFHHFVISSDKGTPEDMAGVLASLSVEARALPEVPGLEALVEHPTGPALRANAS